MTRKQRAHKTFEALRHAIPSPETELEYTNPYELLVAVILSAQCTDDRVNKVTPTFLEAFPDIESLSRAEPEQVYPLIKSISYPNNKSKHLVGMATMVVEEFAGAIPDTIAELMRLPGVGRKTAQVVASVAFDVDALPVDTHVFRVANRVGLVKNANTPVKVERQLKRLLPADDWGEAHHLLILHGRYTCVARNPKCNECPARQACMYFERLQRLPRPLSGLRKSAGRYFCKTGQHYFDDAGERIDRYGEAQISCPRCGSMMVFNTKTGATTKKVPDFRV